MKTLYRTALSLALIIAVGVGAAAQSSKLYVKDFCINKGEVKTIYIYLDNSDYSPSALQFDIYLSGGLQIVKEDGEEMIYPVTDRAPSAKYNWSGKWSENHSYYRYLMYSQRGTKITGTSGALFEITLTTDDTFGTTTTPPSIEFQNVRLSHTDNTETSYKASGALAHAYQNKSLKDILESASELTAMSIDSKLKVSAVCNTGNETLAFATDGSDWIKLSYPNGNCNLVEGVTYDANSIGGIVSDLAGNPTITVNDDLEDKEIVAETNIEIKDYADIEKPMQFKANEVVSLTGHFFIDNGVPAISRWSGYFGPRGVILYLNESWSDFSNLTFEQCRFPKVAVQARGTSNGPRKIQEDRATYGEYEFYVVGPVKRDEIITAVDDVNAASGVASVKYYNLAGVESATPHDGVNIVVTTHADGSKTSTKTVF